MRSTASFKSHPIHPMLVAFPFAYLTGAFAFAVAGALSRRRELTEVSRHLIPAGVAAGLAAAIPGLIDYQRTVPPESSAKDRATRHALINTSALALFTAAWLAGRRTRSQSVSLALEGLGTAAIAAGGWLGGTLVVRNQIGVDHRYANAGRWSEQTIGTDRQLPAVDEGLGLDQMKLVHADNERVVVARVEEGTVAFQDRCTHKGGPLSDGVLICGTVQCPWHGSQFDVRSGKVKCGPAQQDIETYELPLT